MYQKSATEEGKEFFSAFKKQNPFLFWSGIISLFIFFVPVINLLLSVYWAVVITFKLAPNIKNRFRNLISVIFFSAVTFVSVFILVNIPVFGYNNALLSNNQNTSKIDEKQIKERRQERLEYKKTISQEKEKRGEAEKIAINERSKREEEEKSKAELERKIAQATTINVNYDVGNDLEAQEPEKGA